MVRENGGGDVRELYFESSTEHLSLYQRADTDAGKGVLECIVQIPQGGPIARTIKRALDEYYKGKGMSGVKVCVKRLKTNKGKVYFFEFKYT